MRTACFRLLLRIAPVLLALALLKGAPSPAIAQELPGCETTRVLSLQASTLSGLDVLELQERLNSLGYGPLVLDGVYGPQTDRAVRAFQTDHGLSPTGIVTSETWDALAGERVPAASPGPSAPPQGELHIVVDTNRFTLTLYADGAPYKTYRVAVGRPSQFTLSPVGEWRIVSKSKDWGGGFGTRWMGLNVPWGIYGIHGTNKPWSIGTRASAGCIRMLNRDVEELYEWVPVGTRVIILGSPPDVSFDRTLKTGMTGRDVVFVQMRLRELGFDPQGADGRFGPNTERAVRELQRLYGLPVDGTVYEDVYHLLGLK